MGGLNYGGHVGGVSTHNDKLCLPLLLAKFRRNFVQCSPPDQKGRAVPGSSTSTPLWHSTEAKVEVSP